MGHVRSERRVDSHVLSTPCRQSWRLSWTFFGVILISPGLGGCDVYGKERGEHARRGKRAGGQTWVQPLRCTERTPPAAETPFAPALARPATCVRARYCVRFRTKSSSPRIRELHSASLSEIRRRNLPPNRRRNKTSTDSTFSHECQTESTFSILHRQIFFFFFLFLT